MAQEMTEAEQVMDPPHPDAALRPMLLTVVRALPPVRHEAVGRARLLLASPAWCRADEVADRLVDCLIGLRVP
jgi:hypothetical protein